MQFELHDTKAGETKTTATKEANVVVRAAIAGAVQTMSAVIGSFTTFATLLDAEKTYDSVRYELLRYRLLLKGAPGNAFRVINTRGYMHGLRKKNAWMYAAASSRVRVDAWCVLRRVPGRSAGVSHMAARFPRSCTLSSLTRS